MGNWLKTSKKEEQNIISNDIKKFEENNISNNSKKFEKNNISNKSKKFIKLILLFFKKFILFQPK